MCSLIGIAYHTCIHTYIHLYIHTYMRSIARFSTHHVLIDRNCIPSVPKVCMYMCTYVCPQYVCMCMYFVCMYACIYVCTHRNRISSVPQVSMYVCTYVCPQFVCKCVCVCMYVQIVVCMCDCIRIYARIAYLAYLRHVCMYVYMVFKTM
jgi:hypothetical protein